MATTGATVPPVAPLLGYGGVYTSRVVRGDAPQWGGYAEAANHVLGRGVQIIPASLLTLQLSTTPEDLYFYVAPNPQATTRLWTMVYEVKGGGAGAVVFDDGTNTTTTSHGAVGTFKQFHVDTNGTFGGGAESELVVSVSQAGGSAGTVELQSISCVEIPRPDLGVGSDNFGTVLSTLGRGRPVGGAYTTGKGAISVATAAQIAETRFWRAGLFQFARGTTYRLSTTAGALADVFLAPPVLLGTKQYTTSTTRTLSVYARCAAGAGTTGEVVFTMTSGATLTLTITSAMSPGWLSGTLAVDCEDLSVADGRRSTRDDKCSIQWRRTGGANAVYLESISIING